MEHRSIPPNLTGALIASDAIQSHDINAQAENNLVMIDNAN